MGGKRFKHSYLTPTINFFGLEWGQIVCDSLTYGAKGNAGGDLEEGDEHWF